MKIKYQGKIMPVYVVEKMLGYRYGVVRMRIKSGWSIERATTEPTRTINKR